MALVELKGFGGELGAVLANGCSLVSNEAGCVSGSFDRFPWSCQAGWLRYVDTALFPGSLAFSQPSRQGKQKNAAKHPFVPSG